MDENKKLVALEEQLKWYETELNLGSIGIGIFVILL